MRTYTPEEFAAAVAGGRRTANGMVYTTCVSGKKTAGVSLFKEPHHTTKDVQAARRDINGKFRLGAEIETLAPSKEGRQVQSSDLLDGDA